MRALPPALLLLCFALLTPRPAVRAEAFIVQIDMTGSQNVPRVDTQAYGFVRFFFDETRRNAEYTVDVKGISGSLVTGAELRRGQPGTNGPLVRRLADGGFLVTSGRLRLTPAELEEMLSGNWYVVVRTLRHPDGEIRGQVVLPPDFLPPTPATEAAPLPEQPASGPESQNGPLPPPLLAIPGEQAGNVALPAMEAVLEPVAPAREAGPVRLTPPNTGSAGLLTAGR
jgi:hypothetical protein